MELIERVEELLEERREDEVELDLRLYDEQEVDPNLRSHYETGYLHG